MSKVLIVGASGTVGSEVARILKEQGHEVRTTTGKASGSKNQVQLNVITGEGRSQAFEGIERAFLLSPSGYAAQDQILIPLIEEAKKHGLKKVVLLSAFGADASEEAPLRKAEIALEKSGLTYNVIRPNWFMQNFNSFWVQGIREQGKILLPAKKAKTSFIDTRDIAAVAAKLLVTDDHNNQSFNLTGPEALDHDQVAERLSQATGKKVVYQEITPHELRQGLLSVGLNQDYTEFLLLIMGYLSEGYNSAVNSEVKKILGRDPIYFSKYAQDFKKSYL